MLFLHRIDYYMKRTSKAAQRRISKLERLNEQSELRQDGGQRHICRDGLPSLSHGRPKGCHNAPKVHNGELLNYRTTLSFTESEVDYIKAKAYCFRSNMADIIRKAIDMARQQDLSRGRDYVMMEKETKERWG